MFITNHVLAGALVGAALRRRPAAAFAVGFASHVLMDLTPHWGDATLDRDGFYRVARRDGLCGLAALGAVAVLAGPPRRAVLAGIAGACVLDVDKPCEHLLGIRPFPPWLDRFHAAIQTESPRWVWTEVLAGVLGVLGVVVDAATRRAARGRVALSAAVPAARWAGTAPTCAATRPR